MNANQPILFIDSDQDDQELLKPILQELAPDHPVLLFNDGETAFDFLQTTEQKPFLIISEITMPRMTGLELRRQIEQDPKLRKKAIPFIFFTHPAYEQLVDEAYELTIQGFFEKQSDILQIRHQLKVIIDYWQDCLHPNRARRNN
ncbi:response regulator receiver protein [Fibrella aestuarina BUZ 2]|uniref:Response regulator receiver protein n=1 Tax=Fibrella aestuarina BUZ 2 TaxID=1166018 RepID=I0KBA9_9BACT|nr:response regulator [Fibrella aestuarina]CCH01412.1 response regulator receiver protein [Fibrella aestuarina BUZ 2]